MWLHDGAVRQLLTVFFSFGRCSLLTGIWQQQICVDQILAALRLLENCLLGPPGACLPEVLFRNTLFRQTWMFVGMPQLK